MLDVMKSYFSHFSQLMISIQVCSCTFYYKVQARICYFHSNFFSFSFYVICSLMCIILSIYASCYYLHLPSSQLVSSLFFSSSLLSPSSLLSLLFCRTPGTYCFSTSFPLFFLAIVTSYAFRILHIYKLYNCPKGGPGPSWVDYRASSCEVPCHHVPRFDISSRLVLRQSIYLHFLHILNYLCRCTCPPISFLFLSLSIYLCIYLPTHLSIYLSIYLCIYISIYISK